MACIARGIDFLYDNQLPACFQKTFEENLSDAGSIGFGFERNEKTCVYKVYQDFLTKWKKFGNGPSFY